MSVIAAAAIGSTVVSGVTAIASSNAQVKSIGKGIAAETKTADKNLLLQKEIEEKRRQDFAPWREAGAIALQEITEGVKNGAFSMDDFQYKEDPGFQFRFDQGVKALDRSAAARGRVLSGAQDKSIQRYGQDYGSNEYAKAYARELGEKTRNFNILSGISNAGQSSAAQQGAASSQLAASSGNILTNLGSSTNNAYRDQGNARATGYAGIATSLNQGAENWLTYKGLK